MKIPLKLLVLSCCAPCSCGALKKLHDEGTAVTVLFYNPNIYPQAEYEKRRDEQKRVCTHFHIPFVELPYDPAVWEKSVKGLENEPERGKRCSKCFYIRLKRASRYAREHGFDALTSVLAVSRHKDLAQLNEMARLVWMEEDQPYVATNWRKDGVEELRQALIKELKLYTQEYCGCKYSRARYEKNHPPAASAH